MDKRGSCQHDDEPLPHFLYDQLEDQNNFFSGIMQRSAGSAGLQRRSFSDSTHPPFEGTRLIKNVFRKGLQALILKISILLKFAGRYRHVVILMAILILIQVACADVQVPINCTSGAVITSPNYPATYPQFENKDWFFIAPEGRMILLNFNNFSLGSVDDVVVIDIVDSRNRQIYSGVEITIPPFLSRGNELLLRFKSDRNPTGNGFNVSASCYELSGTRVGRLVGGNTPAEGFLELQAESGGEWMRVCEEHPADRVAEVVCRELGYPGAKEVSYEHRGCSLEGTNPDCIRAPSCGNNTYRSQDCSASPEECTSSLAVKVKCFEPAFKGCYDLGNTQLQNGSSYNSTSLCVTSCRVDTSKAIAIINGSECFCSTSDDIGLSSFSQVEALSCVLHQLVYNASVGFCSQMDDVINGSWDSDVTWFGSIVHLTCDDGYRLNGSGTLQCVTKVPSYLHVWNGSIPTCELITEQHLDIVKTGSDNAAIVFSSVCVALFIGFIIICAVIWTCRGKILRQCAALSTAIGEPNQTSLNKALPQTPIDRSQHVIRMPQNLTNSSTLHPSLEINALQHGNNNYAPGNLYNYAISMTNPPQATPNMGIDVNAYEPEDMTDQNTINAGHRTEMMPMFNSPLPHRPILAGVREDPSLPPRERPVIHSSTHSPNLRQNARSDDLHLGACSLTYNSPTNGGQGVAVNQMPQNCAITKKVVVIYPFKGTTFNENAHHVYYSADDFEHDEVHKGGDFPLLSSKLNPFYHCLEDDDQQMCSNDCDTGVLINNESNAHDDNLAEVMVDNVLYNPMDF